MQYPLPIARLIDNYMKLPGIGEKTATRLAFYTMDMPEDDVEDFSKSLMQVKDNGLYHVLHGVLSPMDGVGPEEINIKSLITRLQKQDEVKEVILALNSSPEGEATAMYLAKLIKPAGLKVTRLAAGLAVGSDIEYANSITLTRAVQGRTDL